MKLSNIKVTYKQNTATIHGDFEEFIDIMNEKQNQINESKKEIFLKICTKIGWMLNSIVDELSSYVAKIDLHYTLCIFFKKKSYTRPVLTYDPGVISAVKVRHPLIEKIVADEGKDYISNDIDLSPMNCWMLHGVNSVGKSSLLKSIMINVVLAQAGLFVAASNFMLNPFHVIGCRIGNDDDIFSGQSSFVKEAMEIDLILRKAMKTPSLIITDEMCSSTESRSAFKIIASLLQILSERRITFACATHLFELQNNKYIRGLRNLNNVHLSVEFTNGDLHYTRHIQYGLPNVQDYGTMVSKIMIHDKRFRTLVDSSWHDSSNQNDSQISISSYNKKSIKIHCEICGYQPMKDTDSKLDTHHIKFQCSADQNGNVKEGLHKNQLCNLVTLCHSCHTKVHEDNIIIHGYRDTSQGTILNFTIL